MGVLENKQTVDHGEMFGEQAFPIPAREYGYPTGTYTPRPTELPWLIADTGPRRSTVVGDLESNADEHDDAASDVIEERRKELGDA